MTGSHFEAGIQAAVVLRDLSFGKTGVAGSLKVPKNIVDLYLEPLIRS
jgi:hypothetical protein